MVITRGRIGSWCRRAVTFWLEAFLLGQCILKVEFKQLDLMPEIFDRLFRGSFVNLVLVVQKLVFGILEVLMKVSKLLLRDLALED